MPDAPPADAATPAALGRLGDALRTAGYTEPAVLERLGAKSTLFAPESMSVERRRLGGDGLSGLIRLFLLHDRVSGGLVDADGVEFLERSKDEIVSGIAVQPWWDVLVAHDWNDGPADEDHVIGASGVTAALAALTVRHRVGDALDLCTGSGAQAVLASRHAERVVGVELGARALQFAEWTLALNGVVNVDLRRGDARDASAGEQFDLVTANPPFVVSPDQRWLFRDAGPDISRALVERAPSLLREDGYAHLLCQWGLAAGEHWDEQPRSWVAGRGCDAWILRLPTNEDVLEYTANWNRPLVEGPDFERTVNRWLEHFAREGIERVVSGAVVLRRRSGETWVKTDDATVWPADPAGEHVERLFDGQTFVQSLDDEALLGLSLQPSRALRLDETRGYGESGLELVAAQVRGGLPLRTKVNRPAIAVLERLDGSVRLRDIPDSERALRAIRELLAVGLLVDRRAS